MGTTTNNAWPYPSSSDPVGDGATNIQNLAQGIDTSVGTGLLAWTDYDTFTVGGTNWGTTPTKNGRYCKLGKIVFFDYQITAGGTGMGFSATVTSFTLPVNANTNTNEYIGTALFSDASAGISYDCTAEIAGTSVNILIKTASGVYTRTQSLNNATTPAVLAASDVLRVSGWYEAA